MPLTIIQIPVLDDNYIYLIHEPTTDVTAVVDPAVAEPVVRELERRGWNLTHILNTHHHGDHIGANEELKRLTGCAIVGPRADKDRIPGIDIAVGDGESYFLGSAEAKVFDVPGHTRGHIAYWFADDKALFCGDTLFALGCGRMFEGSAPVMWASLLKLRALPDDTRVYCAHEYTESNARFALSVEPGNAVLQKRAAEVKTLRAAHKPTVPSLLGDEKATNPFLRPDSAEIQQHVHLPHGDPAAVFGAVRALKDNFRG